MDVGFTMMENTETISKSQFILYIAHVMILD